MNYITIDTNCDTRDRRFKILPELEALIEPLTNEEYVNLAKSIAEFGVRDDLIFWEKSEDEFILIDGHNRFSICEARGLYFNMKSYYFQDLEAVKNWMLENQLSRRNLTEAQKSYYRGKLYQEQKNSHGGDRKSQESKVQNEPLIEKPKSTAEQMGDKFGVSDSTIKRDELFVKALDRLCSYSHSPSTLKWAILNKNIYLSKKQVLLALDLTDLEVQLAVQELDKGQIPKVFLDEVEKPKLTEAQSFIQEIKKKSQNQANSSDYYKIPDAISSGYYYYEGNVIQCWFLVFEEIALAIDFYLLTDNYAINPIVDQNSEYLLKSKPCKAQEFDIALQRAYAYFTQITRELPEVLLGKGYIQLTKQMFDELQEKSRELRIITENIANTAGDSSRKKLEKAGFTLIRSDCSRTKPFLKKYQNGTWVKIEAFETKVEMEKRMKELELDDTIIFD